MKNINNFFTIGKQKVYFDRSRMYWVYIQIMILLATYMELRRDSNFGQWYYSHLYLSIPITLLVGVLTVWALGVFDELIVHPKEIKEIASRDKIKMGTYNTVNEILKILKK